MRIKINLDRPLESLLALSLTEKVKKADCNPFDPEIYGFTNSHRHSEFRDQFKSWEYPDPETLPE